MGLLSDSLTVLATQLVFFLIGWIFFVKKLFKDYELRHYMVNLQLSCVLELFSRKKIFFETSILFIMKIILIQTIPLTKMHILPQKKCSKINQIHLKPQWNVSCNDCSMNQSNLNLNIPIFGKLFDQNCWKWHYLSWLWLIEHIIIERNGYMEV